jgi:hypothetical protein
VRIDAITLALLVIAAIPWLRPLFKSLELPGGLKVEFQDVKNVTERADAAGLVASQPPGNPNTYSFQLIADNDPNLALAGLRIELERHLGQLAESDRKVSAGCCGNSISINSLTVMRVLSLRIWQGS